MSSTRQKDAPGSTSRPEESSEELGSRPGEDAGRERRSRSRSPGANASKSSTSASSRGHKKSRSKSKAKTGESASGCSRSTDALPPAEGSSDRGQGQDGGPGAVTAEGAGLVDVANLAPMIAALIDQKFGQMSNANHRDERRRRHRSTSSESSDTDSSDEADSTPEDSDDPEYGDGRHYGRDRSSTRNAKRGRHDACAAPRRRRSASAEPKHGGAQIQQHDSGSEDDSDPFAAIAQVAAASKSAQNTGNVDKYKQAIGDIAQFFDNGDKVGEKVEEKFASIFHGGLRRQPNDKLLLDMIEKYPHPENIAGLNVPKTNDVVWDSMKKGPQVVDASIQKVQTVLAKALVPVIHMVACHPHGEWHRQWKNWEQAGVWVPDPAHGRLQIGVSGLQPAQPNEKRRHTQWLGVSHEQDLLLEVQGGTNGTLWGWHHQETERAQRTKPAIQDKHQQSPQHQSWGVQLQPPQRQGLL